LKSYQKKNNNVNFRKSAIRHTRKKERKERRGIHKKKKQSHQNMEKARKVD
jgi:hypothetical protein